ncbi:Portal protein, HK97 family [Neorhizobium galegae bv. officinalis bv. officinalis str. HAMBI 1141]|uniref:Portal protein, HK97 family n=1 Tax=Neorhizobium galegae bv. officinalis bv. officinalis str. HAMBI 1141 TaxID=1028801 RepID=A0A068T3B9_NEOGA|nr:phage portal protein [Neorhizobium galegae]CDN52526.1 Portal protein, HK97 family [Neorhizobium galegae bv. officinalis bv. officinalis str. HAMBI 1141]
MTWLGRMWNRVTGWGNQPTSSRIVHTGRTIAGVYVDADTALKNATVWACVQYLTRAVSQLPWHVMVKDASGNATVSGTHPLDWLLSRRPCPDYGSFAWRQAMVGNALLRGNAYAEIQWDNRGMPYALWPIHPDRVAVRRAANGELEYEVWNNGGNTVVAARDMFHLRGFGDGVVGYNVIEYAAQSIGWAQATEVFGASYFGDGMNPTMIIETENTLSPEALEMLKAEVDQLYKGPRGRRTAILDAGMKANKITGTPDDGQFIETRQHQVEEICRWFGVPPHKVMHLLRATFSNIEHQSIEVVVDCVTPWVRLLEEEADYKLFGATNRQNFYTKMALQALMRGDNASRIAFYQGMHGMGMTINQILALEDMNGIGPEGDIPFVSNNVQPLSRALQDPAPPPEPSTVDDTSVDPAPKPNGALNGKPFRH